MPLAGDDPKTGDAHLFSTICWARLCEAGLRRAGLGGAFRVRYHDGQLVMIQLSPGRSERNCGSGWQGETEMPITSKKLNALLNQPHPLVLRKADLIRANLSDADLRGADLSEANLSYANLQRAVLGSANLINADLSWSDLSGADLRRALLIGAYLEGANLSGANLSGNDLRHLDLRKVTLAGANLRKTDLSWAHLDEADVSGAVYDKDTQWPAGFDPLGAGAVSV